MAVFQPLTQFSGSAQYAIHTYMGAYGAMPIVVPIDPFWDPGGRTWVQPGAKLLNDVNVPFPSSPGLTPFEGRWVFKEGSNTFARVTRGMWTTGAKINVFNAAEINFTSWDKQPNVLAIEIGNNPSLMFVYLVNGCYSGKPQDKAGNIKKHPGLSPCIDQIYGGKIAVKQGDTANYKPTHPTDPSVGENWFNAWENFDITNGQSYIPVLENMQRRLAMNAVELGLGDEGLELWVNFGRKERARLLLEVFRELASSGIVTPYVVQSGVNNTGVNSLVKSYNDQVLFGQQPNPVFGRMKVRGVTGLRDDLAVISGPRPTAGPETSMFMYAHGGQVGEYAVQEDPVAMRADTVPHIAVYQWTQQSPMFAGAMEGTQAGDLGLSMIINEGAAWLTGVGAEFMFTGAAS